MEPPPPLPAVCTAQTVDTSKEYAFEVATSTIRFGPGVTQEVGFDLAHMGARNVLLVTDNNLRDMQPVKTARLALERAGVHYSVFSDVRVEPTDESMQTAIAFARAGKYDAFLAVGGGSVMDTAKAANLYATFPGADFLDFVNAPVGKGLAVPGPVKPLIAVPTTSGDWPTPPPTMHPPLPCRGPFTVNVLVLLQARAVRPQAFPFSTTRPLVPRRALRAG